MTAALVVGHPGHELLVHGWLEETRPLVFVLTDGSGRSDQSRLASTTKILDQTGACAGGIYGRLTDAAAYGALLNHDFDLFRDLARELCEAFVTNDIDCVAGDALEGYNPMHDVCRLLINAAVTAAQRLRGREVRNFDFSLIGQVGSHEPHEDGICHRLDDQAFARKMEAANGYAELAGEVGAAQARTTADDLKVECLRPVVPGVSDYDCDQAPFYESYGERQVTAGHYQTVVRYREHLAPLATALSALA
ncbi:MAG: hypothetical protein QOD75_1237 [Blastocatellia bacterium]|nr:hypothetical protein [Blastocatellia bacterium]